MLVRDILEIKSSCVVESRIHGVSADSKMGMAAAIRTMRMHDIGAVAVCQEERFVGLVTLREVLVALDLYGGEALSMAITDIMNSLPIVGYPDDSINQVHEVMTKHHIGHLPIVDGERLLGIISLQDVAKAVYRECKFENGLLKHYISHWPEQAETADA